jgi:hypothetical protein
MKKITYCSVSQPVFLTGHEQSGQVRVGEMAKHVASMRGTRNVYKILVGKHEVGGRVYLKETECEDGVCYVLTDGKVQW